MRKRRAPACAARCGDDRCGSLRLQLPTGGSNFQWREGRLCVHGL